MFEACFVRSVWTTVSTCGIILEMADRWSGLTFIPWTGGWNDPPDDFLAITSLLAVRFANGFLLHCQKLSKVHNPIFIWRKTASGFLLWRHEVITKLVGGLQTGTTHNHACRQDSNEIPTATPMFSGTGNPMTLTWKLSDVTGSQKSKMAADKPEIHHILACRQDSNEIPTATPMFSGTGNSMTLTWKLSDVTGSQRTGVIGNANMAT